jgi:protein TonB
MTLHTSVQERLVAASIAALIVLLAGYALIIGLSVDVRSVGDRTLALIDLPAPPPPPPPRQRVERAHSKAAKQAPSPRNLKNEASRIVVPPPVIPLPVPPPIIAAPRAGLGMAPSNGASNRAGPGQGAGGVGNGLGGGGDGDGDGDDIPPRQTAGRLKFSDMPADMRAAGKGGSVEVRYRVGVDGRASECIATKSSGNAELDQLTCQLIEQRFRFRPSRTSDGEPVSSLIVETHSWYVDRSDEAPAKP